MTEFPDTYKKALLDQANGIVEVATVLAVRHPELTLHECCSIVGTAHVDATVSLLFNSLTFTASQSVRKIK